MKTEKTNTTNDLRKWIFATNLLMLTAFACAQEAGYNRTLFSPEMNVACVWSPGISLNKIQGETGVLLGGYTGVLIDNKILTAVTGGVNLGHPTVNYGYFGGKVQYIVRASDLVHFSGQVVLGWGSTKDYETPKEGLFDNFWNISGELFFIKEPGINVEVNLSDRFTLVTGVSYRMVTGIDPGNENISKTLLTNQDMSGFNLNISLRIRKKV